MPAGIVDAVVIDIRGDEVSFCLQLGAGVAHRYFDPVVCEHGHVVQSVAEHDGVRVIGAQPVHDALDADGFVGGLDEEVFAVVAAPGEGVEVLELLLLAGQAGDVHLVDLVEGAGIEARDDSGLHVNVVCEIFEAAVGRGAVDSVVYLEGPGHPFGGAFVDKPDDEVFGERGRAVEFIVDRDSIAAVADHAGKAQLMHAVDRHGLQPPGGDAQKMAGLPAFLKCQDRGVRYVGISVAAGQERPVYVKEQISFSFHRVPFFRCIGILCQI